MRNFQIRRRQFMSIFLLAFVGLFSITPTALADNVHLQGDTIDSGETVQNDVFLNGTDIALNGTVVGDVLAVGRSVVINGEVQGSMVILAENIVINGDIQNSVYAASVSLNTLSGSTIERNLNFLGISLSTERDSQIGRDLNAITLGARQSGSVGRNTTVISGISEIARLILDRLNTVTTGKPVAIHFPAA
jgi:cytoskeletal protein CcmA (bactofilin family)